MNRLAGIGRRRVKNEFAIRVEYLDKKRSYLIRSFLMYKNFLTNLIRLENISEMEVKKSKNDIYKIYKNKIK